MVNLEGLGRSAKGLAWHSGGSGEVWGGLGRSGEVWGASASSGEVWGGSGELRSALGRYGVALGSSGEVWGGSGKLWASSVSSADKYL